MKYHYNKADDAIKSRK